MNIFFSPGAKGSFGLMVSSSVDCDRSLALAARGQSISVALYPESKTFLWGSELGAVKAGLTGDDEQDRGSVSLHKRCLGAALSHTCQSFSSGGGARKGDGAKAFGLD